jgi:hypothetical protein
MPVLVAHNLSATYADGINQITECLHLPLLQAGQASRRTSRATPH